MTMNIKVVIPARYQSSRLPGKPLVDLAGVPMIVRTYRQCAKAVDPKDILVATDDKRISDVCEAEGIQTIMTSSDCLTGTDRVAEVAETLEADCYVNVQGDEPLFNPQDLLALVEAARRHPGEVLNGYCPISDEELFRNPSIPKVVMAPDERLLYMSRAPIPTNKALRFVRSWRQVCAYAFPRAALAAYASQTEKTPLEAIEDIEILRFLETGISVRMVPMSDQSIAVDTPEDVEKVEKAIQQRGIT